jgi:hypothetical protein
VGRVEIADDVEVHARAAMAKLFQDKLGPDITEDAIRYAPVGPSWGYDPAHPRTPPHEGGELKESISFHVTDDAVLVIRADAPYSADVEMGTRPHAIGAHGPWSLWSPVTGQRFGRAVMNPGSKPRSFLRRALFTRRSG